jgi:hypothetical protein
LFHGIDHHLTACGAAIGYRAREILLDAFYSESVLTVSVSQGKLDGNHFTVIGDLRYVWNGLGRCSAASASPPALRAGFKRGSTPKRRF